MNQTYQPIANNSAQTLAEGCELFEVIDHVGIGLLNELTGIHLSPQDLYDYTIDLLDKLRLMPQYTEAEINYLWDHLYNDLLTATHAIDREEVCKSTGIIMGFAILALYSSTYPQYQFQIPEMMITCINTGAHRFDQWDKTLNTIFDATLPQGWFDRWQREWRKRQAANSQSDTKMLEIQKKMPPGSMVNYYHVEVNSGGQFQPTFHDGSTNYQQKNEHYGE